MRPVYQAVGFAVAVVFLAGCAGDASRQTPRSAAPSSTHGDSRFDDERKPASRLQEDACALLAERPHWGEALRGAHRRWRLEPWFALAFIHQESRFAARAKSRSGAYGYAQSKDATWRWYRQESGNRDGKRDRFDDAVDFIGFYVNRNHRRNGVAFDDVKNQYLAYHEGMGGFARGSYLGKPWLLKVADKVVERARRYREQLAKCPL